MESKISLRKELMQRFTWVRLEFWEKSSIVLLYQMQMTTTSRLLNRRGRVDLTLLRTRLAVCQKSWESSFWEMISSFFINISKFVKFGSFKNPFPTIIACLDLNLTSGNLLCWYNQKMISMSYGSSTSSWKPWTWVSLELISTMRNIHQFKLVLTQKI